MNMKRLTLVAAALIACLSQGLQAQESHPEYQAVMAVVEQFFTAINNSDGALLGSLEVEGAAILNIREDAAGDHQFVERQWFDADSFASGTRLTERYWDEEVLVSDHLAVFWAPYDFHIDGEFSHCGIDVLSLIKIEGQWKIGSAMWTVQRPNCEASPLGPL